MRRQSVLLNIKRRQDHAHVFCFLKGFYHLGIKNSEKASLHGRVDFRDFPFVITEFGRKDGLSTPTFTGGGLYTLP
jgi:hypothetical protein